MEVNQKKESNLKSEINKNITEPLRTRKKPKGCSRFLRNVIKDKAKVMKEILKNRFFKWRKDALRGKIKKTVMIRISVSREKDPKPKHQIGKARPKELPKSVNKNDLRTVNMNNIPKNITNIQTQNINKIIKEDKASNNKRINIDQNKNILIKKDDKKGKEKENINRNVIDQKKIQNQPRKDPKVNKIMDNKKMNPYDKNKINKKTEKPKIIPKSNRVNQVNNLNLPKSNQNKIRTYSQDLNKTPLLNNNAISYPSSSSNKRNYQNENKYPKENNYMRKVNQINQNITKDKIPKVINKNYGGKPAYTPLAVKTVKIDLTENKYNNRTFNRRYNNKPNSYENLSFDKNLQQNKLLYNHNNYQTRNNNNDNKSTNTFSIKSGDYNKELSQYSGSRKESTHTYGPTSLRNNLKGGITTVIQHYRGEKRRFDNYDNNTYDANKIKINLNWV